jgi:hypothetical protein
MATVCVFVCVCVCVCVRERERERERERDTQRERERDRERESERESVCVCGRCIKMTLITNAGHSDADPERVGGARSGGPCRAAGGTQPGLDHGTLLLTLSEATPTPSHKTNEQA